MTGIHRILSDLSRQMVAEGYPVHCAMDAEAMILSFLANQGRKAKAEADAAKALARGWRSAAECQGVHPATIYRRANRFSRKTREIAKG